MSLFKKKPTVTTGPQDMLERELATIDEVLANYAIGYELPFGAATRCPRCAKVGHLTSVNKFKGVTHTTCLTCNISWVITERALEEHRRTLQPARRSVLQQQQAAYPRSRRQPAEARGSIGRERALEQFSQAGTEQGEADEMQQPQRGRGAQSSTPLELAANR